VILLNNNMKKDEVYEGLTRASEKPNKSLAYYTEIVLSELDEMGFRVSDVDLSSFCEYCKIKMN
jgi:hypothetical protein